MKTDIRNRDDIVILVDAFYDRIRQDTIIGNFFTETRQVNWEKHLPLMYSFWEKIVFGEGNYMGNPMQVHQHINDLRKIEKVHFQQWIQVFREVAESLFEGANTTLIVNRATSIAGVMQAKLEKNNLI